MHIIENLRILLATDHVAWADGPGWLLGMLVAWVAMGVTAACVAR